MDHDPSNPVAHGAEHAGVTTAGGTDVAQGTSGTGDAVGGAGTSGPGSHQRPARRGAKGRRGLGRWLLEWAVILVVALLVAFLVRTFVAQTFYVPSTSMYPTLKAGDRIVVNKLFSTVHRGDIIVFKRPASEDCGGPPVPDLVKRVVGLPGETIAAKQGQVLITGSPIAEPWLPSGPQAHTTNFGPVTIAPGHYFVMGDNRVNSCDSRMWGTVTQSLIVGKVVFIIWPPSQLRFF